MLHRIKTKFAEQEAEWEMDFARELKRFSKESLMKCENNAENEVYNDKSPKSPLKKMKTNRRSSVIDKLNNSLMDKNVTFDDVKNILIRDREDRERNEMLKKHKSLINMTRLTL